MSKTELPEWYKMAEEFLNEIRCYSTDMYNDMNGESILTQLRYAAERDSKNSVLSIEVEKLSDTAEQHRTEYNRRYEQMERPIYWDGRRDEAGWFRDKLQSILKASDK